MINYQILFTALGTGSKIGKHSWPHGVYITILNINKINKEIKMGKF